MSASTAGMAYVSSQQWAPPRPALGEAPPAAAPVVAPPLLLRPLAPPDARAVNLGIRFSSEPNTAARPFELNADRTSFERAVECLATAIYYEAAAEPIDGQRAIAQVVLNRVRHPAFVPNVCGVVYQGSTRVTGCQFSFTCDGSLRMRPSSAGWGRARAIAVHALSGGVYAPVGHATHYHADYVVPYWATSLVKNASIGRHYFYRWPEWQGTGPAFSRRHSGQEPDPRPLRLAALRRPANSAPLGTPAQPWISTDPRVELLRVVHFLAAGSPDGVWPRRYEGEVRQHFSRFSEHVAVQIYRQLSAQGVRPGMSGAEIIEAFGRPKLLEFVSALRDFSTHSDFHAFLGEQQLRHHSQAAAAPANGASVATTAPAAIAQPVIPEAPFEPIADDLVVSLSPADPSAAASTIGAAVQ